MGRQLTDPLLRKIRTCEICVKDLPYDPRPILNFTLQGRILLVGQAPGIKAHESKKPWNDASGKRLREWLGVSDEQFYDPRLFAIVPMGFCYPGKGKSGDLPPRPECSAKWMQPILDRLKSIELKILVGAYSQNYFLKDRPENLTDTVKNWKSYAPEIFPLPHPSPRNNIWLKKNRWFEKDLIPNLRRRVDEIL